MTDPKFYYYLDLGSGYQLVTPSNIKVKLSWKRGVLNDFIMRKELNGSFVIHDDYAAVKTHFITNGFEEAEIRVYENGISGVGILKYEGWTRVKGLWDDRRSEVTFDSFITNDVYTEFLTVIDKKYYGNRFGAFDTFFSFGVQGQAVNANKLHFLSFSSSNFTIEGNATTVSNLAGCSATVESGEIIVYDGYNATLKGYIISGNDWIETRSIGLGQFGIECTIAGVGGGDVILYSEDGFRQTYELSGSTFNLKTGSEYVSNSVKYPSIAYNGSFVAVVSEDSEFIKSLEGGNFSINIGKVTKPNICMLNTNVIAFIDTNKRYLRAYTYTGGTLVETGNGLLISGIYRPIIANYGTNQIILHDAVSRRLEKYNFDGTDWTKDGNTLALGGGHTTALACSSSLIFLAIADTNLIKGSPMTNLWSVVNNILFLEDLWDYSPFYGINSAGYGSTVDLRKTVIGPMENVSDNSVDADSNDLYEYTIKDTLKSIELWQNYWYIDSSYKINFTQPNLFSSLAVKFDISSLNLLNELDQRLYANEFDIDKEETLFINAYNQDFANNKIDYLRNTSVIKSTNYNFTTDFNFLSDVYANKLYKKIEDTGLILYYNDGVSGKPLALSANGIVSGGDIKNYKVSQSQLYNDYQKDYRYKNQGSFEMNEISTAVQDTCRSIIEFQEVKASQDMLGITEFPDEVSNLVWATGIESLIMDFEMDLGTNVITIRSRLHDL